MPPLKRCFGTSPIQAVKFCLRISNTGNQGRGQRRTNTWNLIEPHAHLVGSVPSHDPTIKLQDLRFQHPQLCPKRRQTATRKFRYPLVTGIGDHIKQLLDTPCVQRRDNPELGMITEVCWRITIAR